MTVSKKEENGVKTTEVDVSILDLFKIDIAVGIVVGELACLAKAFKK